MVCWRQSVDFLHAALNNEAASLHGHEGLRPDDDLEVFILPTTDIYVTGCSGC